MGKRSRKGIFDQVVTNKPTMSPKATKELLLEMIKGLKIGPCRPTAVLGGLRLFRALKKARGATLSTVAMDA